MHSSQIKVVENTYLFPSKETGFRYIFSRLHMSHNIRTNISWNKTLHVLWYMQDFHTCSKRIHFTNNNYNRVKTCMHAELLPQVKQVNITVIIIRKICHEVYFGLFTVNDLLSAAT